MTVNFQKIFKSKVNLFCSIVLISFLMSMFLVIFTHGRAIVYYLHQDKIDSFMDLFKCIAEQKNNWHLNNYPALSMLHFKFFYSIIPEDFWVSSITDRENGFLLRGSLYGQAILFSFLSFFLVPFVFCTSNFLKKYNVKSSVVILTLIFSGPFLFSFERANVIIYSFLFSLFFYFYKDSKNKVLCEFSLISLAISINLKLYPVFFGLFLFYEKRWKDILKCLIYSLILFFLPMLFFPAGFGETIYLFKGVLRFGGLASNNNFPSFSSLCLAKLNSLSFFDIPVHNFLRIAGYRGNNGSGLVLSIQNLCNLFTFFFSNLLYGDSVQNNAIASFMAKYHVSSLLLGINLVMITVIFVFSKKSWCKWFSLTSFIVMFTGAASSVYILLFVAISLFDFLISDDDSRLATVLFGLIFSFLSLPYKIDASVYFVSAGFVIVLMAYYVLYFYVFLIAVGNLEFIKRRVKLCICVFSLTVITVIVACFMFVTHSKAFEGTRLNPFKISSAEDLIYLSFTVNNGFNYKNCYFVQTKDIDLQNVEFTPIGISGFGKYFEGSYNGKNHKIKNLMITKIGGEVGLFGRLYGTVKNLTIESGLIEGTYLGAFTSGGSSDALIKNCINKASVNGIRAGGICDNFAGSVVNCKNLGLTNGKKNGLVVSYSARYTHNIYPNDLPDTYLGDKD